MTPFRAFRLERLRQPLDVASEIRALLIRGSSLQSTFEVRNGFRHGAFVFHFLHERILVSVAQRALADYHCSLNPHYAVAERFTRLRAVEKGDSSFFRRKLIHDLESVDEIKHRFIFHDELIVSCSLCYVQPKAPPALRDAGGAAWLGYSAGGGAAGGIPSSEAGGSSATIRNLSALI